MKPQCEIAVYRRWKQGQAMKNEFRNIFWTCKDNTSKAKAYSKVHAYKRYQRRQESLV